jgi:hypothetical protein
VKQGDEVKNILMKTPYLKLIKMGTAYVEKNSRIMKFNDKIKSECILRVHGKLLGGG